MGQDTNPSQKFMQKIIKTKLKLILRFSRFFCPPPLPVHLPITKKLLSSCLLNFSVNTSIILYITHSKHELPFVCLWKSGTLSPLNTMFICTLQTSSTKIILLTSTLHPRTASIHTVNFGGSRVSPQTRSDQPRPVILQSKCILQKKRCSVFSMS